MPRPSPSRSRDRRRRWTLALAYAALLASCDSPFAPDVQEVLRLDINPAVLTMVVGGNATLVARVYGADDTLLPTAKVFWSSQDPTVVTVSQEGVVSAVGAGTAQIAASSGGQSRTIAVTVSAPPIALVRITPPAGNVVVGGTLTLQGEALDGTGTVLPNRPLEWATSAPAIATVNGAGVVTGIAVGQATISATGEGKTGTALVTVFPSPVASIAIEPNGGSVPAGGTLVLTATPRDAAGQPLTGRTLEWRSSNDAMATVSSAGLLTAISPGTVRITVSAPGAGPNGATPSASVDVTVLIAPVASAVIVPSPASVQVGQTVSLTLNLLDASGKPLSLAGRTITWSSSNVAVASVNASGIVTGVAVGSVTITATITTPGQPSSVQTTVQLTVSNQPVVSVVVTPNPAVVHVGYTRPFTAVARDAAGQPLTGRAIIWTSANQSIASVDASSGVVTGIAVGSVQIRATSEGVPGLANVTVDLVPVSSVVVTPGSATLMPGQTVQLSAAPRDSAGNVIQGAALGGRTTSWVSGNTAAATVSAVGLVTAVAQGASSVSATIGGTAGQSVITVNPSPSASQLAIVTQPSASPQNDITFLVQPVIQLKDASGANVATPGVVVQAAITAPGTGTLGGTLTATTNASGTATFTNLKITGTTGARTLTFTSGSLTPATSGTITVLAGAPTQLVITTQPPSSANSGQVFSSATVVQLRDVSGNNVPQLGTTVTASHTPSAGVTLGGNSVTTSASGAATFSALILTGPAGNYTLTFNSDSLTPAISNSIALGAGSGSKLTLTRQPSSPVQNGQPFNPQPIVQLTDASGNPVALAGVQVNAAVVTPGAVAGGTATALTDASGGATFSGLLITGTAGSHTLAFFADNYTTVNSGPVALVAGNPANVAITTQPGGASSGSPLSPQPSVRVTDVSGNPVNNVGVQAAIASGAGTLTSGSTATTDANGNATFSGLTITGLAGQRILSFTAGSASITSTPFTITAGLPASLTVTTQPSPSAPNDVVFAQQPVVQVQDATGNAVPGVVVTASIASGAGTLGSTGTLQATSDASGFATFSGLKITGTPGLRTLGFSAGALSATSATVNITVGAPASLTVSTAPQSTVPNDVVFSPQPAVTVTDISGTPVPGQTVNVTITAGSGTLGGTPTAVTNAQGIAAFSGLKITGTIGVRTLTFALGSLTAPATVDVTFGSATHLALTTPPPANVVNGSQFSAVVQLQDVSNNNVPTSGTPVSVSMTSGSGTFNATSPVQTSSGSAAFTDLSITGLVGARQLTFASTGLNPVIASVTVTPGAAASLTVTTQPSSSAPNDQAFTVQPVVQVQDASGNAVPAVVVTASIASGAGTLGSTGTLQATSDASGFAAFSGLKITGTTGARTLGFTAGALTASSLGVNITFGSHTKVVFITAPPSTAVSGVPLVPAPSLQLRDVSDNDVQTPGIAVTATITSGSGSLSGTTVVNTDAQGVATFSNLVITGSSGPNVLTFSAGVPGTAQATVTVAFFDSETESMTVEVAMSENDSIGTPASGESYLISSKTTLFRILRRVFH